MDSENWEKTYQAGGHNNSWPWSELVTLLHRFGILQKQKLSEKLSVFEYGCGTGNNYPLFNAPNTSYKAIELSSTAVNILVGKFPELITEVQVGSFATFEPKRESADVIIDRSSITCCNFADIKKAISNVAAQLRYGGIYIGIDWFSTEHSDFDAGKVLENSSRDIISDASGQFAGLGTVHFTDAVEIRQLFSKFELLHLSHKVIEDQVTSSVLASYSIVVRKTHDLG